jgi:hypothetical protein
MSIFGKVSIRLILVLISYLGFQNAVLAERKAALLTGGGMVTLECKSGNIAHYEIIASPGRLIYSAQGLLSYISYFGVTINAEPLPFLDLYSGSQSVKSPTYVPYFSNMAKVTLSGTAFGSSGKSAYVAVFPAITAWCN